MRNNLAFYAHAFIDAERFYGNLTTARWKMSTVSSFEGNVRKPKGAVLFTGGVGRMALAQSDVRRRIVGGAALEWSINITFIYRSWRNWRPQNYSCGAEICGIRLNVARSIQRHAIPLSLRASKSSGTTCICDIYIYTYILKSCPHPPPKTSRVGEVGWGVPRLSDNSLLKSGNQIKVRNLHCVRVDLSLESVWDL